jgi:hypothetical protein
LKRIIGNTHHEIHAHTKTHHRIATTTNDGDNVNTPSATSRTGMVERSLPKIMLGKAKRVNMLENTIEQVNPAAANLPFKNRPDRASRWPASAGPAHFSSLSSPRPAHSRALVPALTFHGAAGVKTASWQPWAFSE